MKTEQLYKRYKDDSVALGVIQELEQLRRSQMQPAVKFLGNDVMKQFRHMYSELVEISDEIKTNDGTWDVGKIIEEIVDLQFSCQTMLEGPLKLSKEQIAIAIQKVKDKNTARNYHIRQELPLD